MANNGTHSESLKKYSSFINKIIGKLGPVNVHVIQISEQTKKNNRILLSIINLFIKTVG